MVDNDRARWFSVWEFCVGYLEKSRILRLNQRFSECFSVLKKAIVSIEISITFNRKITVRLGIIIATFDP